MSPADLAPYVTAVIAVIGTLLGGVVAGVFALLQMKGTQRAQKRDAWFKAYDEQRRLMWGERKVAYAELLRDAQDINKAIQQFNPTDPPGEISTLEEFLRSKQDSYWQVFTFGQDRVLSVAFQLQGIQWMIVDLIRRRQPYDREELRSYFSNLRAAVREGLTGMPDAMKEGLEDVALNSRFEID